MPLLVAVSLGCCERTFDHLYIILLQHASLSFVSMNDIFTVQVISDSSAADGLIGKRIKIAGGLPSEVQCQEESSCVIYLINTRISDPSMSRFWSTFPDGGSSIALRVRFSLSERLLYLNSFVQGGWGRAETHKSLFTGNSGFQFNILIQQQYFQIMSPNVRYTHRTSLNNPMIVLTPDSLMGKDYTRVCAGSV